MNEENQIRGRINRLRGQRFEVKVRDDLTKKNYLVFKNDNQVYLEDNEFKRAKRSFNPFTHQVGIGNGFPDFVCINKLDNSVIFVESKKRKYIDPIEREKVAWIKNNLKIHVQVAFQNKFNEIEYKEL